VGPGNLRQRRGDSRVGDLDSGKTPLRGCVINLQNYGGQDYSRGMKYTKTMSSSSLRSSLLCVVSLFVLFQRDDTAPSDSSTCGDELENGRRPFATQRNEERREKELSNG